MQREGHITHPMLHRRRGRHHDTQSSVKSVSEILAHGYFEWHSRSFILKSIPKKRRSYLPATSIIRLWMAVIRVLPISPSWPSSSSDKSDLDWSAEHRALL